jgi:HAMP domain-containing protein
MMKKSTSIKETNIKSVKVKVIGVMLGLLFVGAPIVSYYCHMVMKFDSVDQFITFWVVLPIAIITWIIPFTLIPLLWLRPIEKFFKRKKEKALDKKFLQKTYKKTMHLPLKLSALLSISWFLGPMLCNLFGLLGTPLNLSQAFQFAIIGWIGGLWVAMVGFIVFSRIMQSVLQIIREKGLTMTDIETSGVIRINIGVRLRIFFMTLVSVSMITVGYLAYVRFEADFGEAFVMIIFGVILVIIAAVLGHLASHSITDPLQGLVIGAKRVSAGDLTTKVPVVSVDEIGQLATLFNQMTENLKKSRSELERSKANLEYEVAARTKELQEKLETLEKFEEVTVGRELKMIELEKEIERLKNK